MKHVRFKGNHEVFQMRIEAIGSNRVTTRNIKNDKQNNK